MLQYLKSMAIIKVNSRTQPRRPLGSTTRLVGPCRRMNRPTLDAGATQSLRYLTVTMDGKKLEMGKNQLERLSNLCNH